MTKFFRIGYLRLRETEWCESGCAEDIPKENNLTCIQDRVYQDALAHQFTLVWKKINPKFWADKCTHTNLWRMSSSLHHSAIQKILADYRSGFWEPCTTFNFQTTMWNIFTLQSWREYGCCTNWLQCKTPKSVGLRCLKEVEAQRIFRTAQEETVES